MVWSLSAHWRDHTDVPWRTMMPWLEFPEMLRENFWALGGGGIKLLLAPLGFVVSLLTPRRRRWGLFAATFGAIAFGLSLGPTVRVVDEVPVIGGICPYELLQQFVPGFSLIRSPFRFALFVQLAAVWLSLEALDLLNPARWLPRGRRETEVSERRLPAILNPLFGFDRDECLFYPIVLPLVLVSVLVTLEAIPPTTPLFEMPSRAGLPAWVVWLRDNAEPNTSVACLPFPTGFEASDYEDTTLSMYWSTYFHRPLVNGYSGFFPASFMKTKEGFENFQRPAELGPEEPFEPHFKHYTWDNPGLQGLRDFHVRYVVVKRSFATRDDIWAHPETRFRWALVASDEISLVDVYQLPTWDE